MLYQLNIITLMVTVTHFKSTGRNQGDHFSIDLHEDSTKLIYIYLEMMIIAVTMALILYYCLDPSWLQQGLNNL